MTTAEDYATVNASYCFSSGIPSSRVIPEGLVQRYRRKDQPITLTECYYNKETSGGDTSWLVDGTGLSTDDMKKQESYVRWDFENTWYMGEDGYPELNFEKILVKQ